MTPEPEIEARPWAEQVAIDDASYREQLAYLYERSAFYRAKLTTAGFASAGGRRRPDGDRAAAADREGGAQGHRRRRAIPSARISAPSVPRSCASTPRAARPGTPSYIPLTADDLDNWVTGSARSYAASGVSAGERIVSTYNAGPFVAGAALAAFDRIELCHIPVGTGNSERLVLAIDQLRPEAAVLTPSYAAYLVEWAAERGFDLRGLERPARARRGRAGRRRAGLPRPARGGLGRPRHRGHGHRRHRPLAVGRVRAAGRHAPRRARVRARRADRPRDGRRAPARGRRDAASSCSRTSATAPRRSCASARAITSLVRTEPVPLRPHRPAGALHRAHRRHADRARRQRLPLGDPRGRERVRCRASAATSSSRRRRRAPSRIRRCPWRSSSQPAPRRRSGAGRGDRRARARRAGRAGPHRAGAVGQPAAQRIQVEARTTSYVEVIGPMRKLQSQGVHHITITGADRQTSIDFWEGVLGMPFVFEQPNLDNPGESHLYFDPGDGRLITVFTNEERTADPRAHSDRAGLRAPPGVRALAGDLQAGGRAPRRARHQAQRGARPRLHGLDLLHAIRSAS